MITELINDFILAGQVRADARSYEAITRSSQVAKALMRWDEQINDVLNFHSFLA